MKKLFSVEINGLDYSTLPIPPKKLFFFFLVSNSCKASRIRDCITHCVRAPVWVPSNAAGSQYNNSLSKIHTAAVL